MINERAYELPSVAYLERGLYIIRYIPEPEFKFSFWELSRINFTSKSETETPNLISVYQSGEVRAYYTKQPELQIDLPSELYDLITIRSPIELSARITCLGKPMAEAEVTFYVDGQFVDAELSDANGYASTIFEPTGERRYTWYVKAEKWGYTSSTSEEWEFTIAEVTLKTFGEILTRLPITLKATVSVEGLEIEDASVDFYIDDVFGSSLFTERNGVASYAVDGVSPGLHRWHVTVWVPGYPNRFAAEAKSFVYRLTLLAELERPEDEKKIVKPMSEVELSASVRTLDGAIPGVSCSFYVEGELVGRSVTDSNGVASFRFSPPVEDREYSWRVLASEPFCLNDTSATWSFYYPVQPPYVEVDDAFSSGARVDVGSVQSVGFHLRWENGSDVKGASVQIAESYEAVTNESGWAILEVTNDQVCEEDYRITNVTLKGMGELRNTDDFPVIIWDRVLIEIHAEKERFDVGKNATLIEIAHYEYDGSPFRGKILYNEELYSDRVIGKTIGVKAIDDEEYNLTNFGANEASLIWDRVKIELHASNSRVQVGDEACIAFQGVYEYDGEPFEGSTELNKDLRQYDIGEVEYEVTGVSDGLYNLSKFTSNAVSCIFDQIEIEQNVDTAIPTRITVVTKARYAYDGRPVEGARVVVNGAGENLGSGSYESVIYSFFPYLELVTEVALDGFDARTIETHTYSIGNSCIWSGLVLSAIYILSRLIRQKKK